ncbi:hypothetical protein C1X69_30475, partial [Pseudomonas sp. FW305-67]
AGERRGSLLDGGVAFLVRVGCGVERGDDVVAGSVDAALDRDGLLRGESCEEGELLAGEERICSQRKM